MPVPASVVPVVLLAALAGAEPPRYTLVEITGLPPGQRSGPAIDNSGRALVVCRNTSGVDIPFVWRDGVLTALPTLNPPERGVARAMSDDGLFGGSCGPFESLTATIWRDGVPEALPTFGTDFSDIMDISPSGNICGYARAFAEQTTWHGFAVIGGVFHGLGPTPFRGGSFSHAINDRGLVAMFGRDLNDRQPPFLWDAEHGLRELPTFGGIESSVLDLDETGNAVGWSQDGRINPFNHQPYALPARWDASGRIHALPIPPGFPTGMANSINESGVIVGEVSHNGLRPIRGVVWFEGQAHFLSDLIHFPSAGWVINSPRDINEGGEIIANAEFDGEQRVVVLRPQ
jgi:uncharacterized membrane protein